MNTTLLLINIVLFTALWTTVAGFIQVFFQVINVVLNKDKRSVGLGMFIIASLAWSVFYYLTH